jgi:hypothetical protein
MKRATTSPVFMKLKQSLTSDQPTSYGTVQNRSSVLLQQSLLELCRRVNIGDFEKG